MENNKCVCKNKFENNSGKIKCLGANDVCQSPKPLYNPVTKECISECSSPYQKKFHSLCLGGCPADATESSNICTCTNQFWYALSDGNYKCLNACLDIHPVYIAETNQCLARCGGSYPHFFENKCYSSCNLIDTNLAENTVPVSIHNDLFDSLCKCVSPWYYDLSGTHKKMKCPSHGSIINDCTTYSGLDYMNQDTLECIEMCPYDHPYYFNQICLVNCENAIYSNYYNVKAVESSFECQCINLWYYTDPHDKKLKHCLDSSINECIEDSNTNYNYEIYKTKECVEDIEDCPSNSFIFNYKCYEKCPDNTIENTESGHEHECICDKSKGYWYEYEKHSRKYLMCGVEVCPQTTIEHVQYARPNLLEKDNNKYHKCVNSCIDTADNTYKYAFRNLCIEKCPEGTKTVVDICEFYDLNNEDEINNLQALKNAANIKAKELYLDSNLKSGYLLNKYDASLQIYSINKDNTYKNSAIKSNLTYIDLDTCINKIFQDGNLPNNEEILVAKYDLLYRYIPLETGSSSNRPTPSNSGGSANNANSETNTDDSIKSLINPVEYEFYLKSNMTKIDGSICDPYEILISYPISLNKNRYNNYETGINDNYYLNRFEIGKLLHQKNSDIDTFNKDNKVYKDICLGIEINGKDLVLEDRYKYLYPNNASLCESNCTMVNTDYDLERINCRCIYKEIIDFKRVDKDSNDILNDPKFNKPTQSGANAEIIKCLSKIDIKQGLIKNEAFYYCLVISAVEISMVAVSFISGINVVSNFIQGMLVSSGGNPNNNIGTVNKMLNNPPKKVGDKEDEKDPNIIIKKNIEIDYKKEDNISDISKDNVCNNYGINIKSEFTKIKINEIQENKAKNNIYNSTINNNAYSGMKAEFIPQEYNFKFFNQKDKGVVKKIKRSQIPFEINHDTKILLEGKTGIIYEDNYLEGPFYEDQNIIEIIDDVNNNNIYYNKIIKYNDNMNGNDITYMSNDNMMKRNTKNNKNEDQSKVKKRILSNNIISEEKELITIKKINPIKKEQQHDIIIENYNEDEEIKKIDDTTSIYNLMKKEHTYLRVIYEKYIAKRHPNVLSIFLAEILDKIYLIKIFIFLKKFDILSVHISLYMFCHLLLLSILCGFFTIKTIKNIWEDSNYPTLNFYLLYGFLSNIIVWIIYRIFSLMLDNQDKIRAFVKLSKDENKNKITENNDEDNINDKYKDLIKKIKIQIAVFYIIILLLTLLCFLYLVSFFAIYTGTKRKVFTAYYISIIEIILIKFVYGLCLASLRIASEGNELKSLYNVVCICDKYLA